jgi:PPIC-type PPIASE domain
VNRPILALAGVLALAMAVSSCSTTNPDAVTVNGVHIKRTAFEADMNTLANNEGYKKAYDAAAKQANDAARQADEQAGITFDPTAEPKVPYLAGESNGSIGKGFTRVQLGNLVLLELVHAELVTRNVVPDATQISQGEKVAQGVLEVRDPTIWTSFPEALRTKYGQRGAEYLALQKELSPKNDTDLIPIFASVQDQLPLCVSHILVATEADAATVVAELKEGKAFADVAKARSTDPGSKDSGGNLGDAQSGSCPTAKDLDPDFVAGAKAAKEGEPTAPVKTQFGYHIIKLDKPLPTIESLRAELTNYGGQQALQQFITKARKEAVVSVDPRYGIWDAANRDGIIPAKAAGTAEPSTAKEKTTIAPTDPLNDPAAITPVSTP